MWSRLFILSLIRFSFSSIYRNTTLNAQITSKDGVSISHNPSTVTISGTDYNIDVTTQNDYDLKLSLNESWAFKPYESIFTLTLDGSIPNDQVDADMMLVFAVGDWQYFGFWLSLDSIQKYLTWIYPSIGRENITSSVTTWITANVPQDRFDRISHGAGWDGWQTIWDGVKAFRGWPMKFVINNNPITNICTFHFHHDLLQSPINGANWYFNNAFPPNQPIDIYIMGHENNERFTISSFHIDLSDESTSSPTSVPTLYPTNSPSKTPTSTPTTSITTVPTNDPTYGPITAYPTISEERRCCDCLIASTRDSFAGCPADKKCEDYVCTLDSYCCTYEWDISCAEKADTISPCNTATSTTSQPATTTEGPTSYPTIFDEQRCCDCLVVSTRQSFSGCPADKNCENFVCGQDPYCCTNEWDQSCIERADAISPCNAANSTRSQPTSTYPSYIPTSYTSLIPTVILIPSQNPTPNGTTTAYSPTLAISANTTSSAPSTTTNTTNFILTINTKPITTLSLYATDDDNLNIDNSSKSSSQFWSYALIIIGIILCSICVLICCIKMFVAKITGDKRPHKEQNMDIHMNKLQKPPAIQAQPVDAPKAKVSLEMIPKRKNRGNGEIHEDPVDDSHWTIEGHPDADDMVVVDEDGYVIEEYGSLEAEELYVMPKEARRHHKVTTATATIIGGSVANEPDDLSMSEDNEKLDGEQAIGDALIHSETDYI